MKSLSLSSDKKFQNGDAGDSWEERSSLSFLESESGGKRTLYMKIGIKYDSHSGHVTSVRRNGNDFLISGPTFGGFDDKETTIKLTIRKRSALTPSPIGLIAYRPHEGNCTY